MDSIKANRSQCIEYERYEPSLDCPKCNNQFLFITDNYCSNCGSKIDWYGEYTKK